MGVWSSGKAELPIQLIEKGTETGSQIRRFLVKKAMNLNTTVSAGAVGRHKGNYTDSGALSTVDWNTWERIDCSTTTTTTTKRL